jgi:iron complex outermembrane receptor protein
MTQRKKTAQKVRSVPAFTLLVSALSAVPAFAQTGSPPAAAGDRTTITVTGSRASNRSAAETAVPVDIIDREMIEATGAAELGRLLQKLAPSFNFPQSFVSDGTDLIWPASLRGMGPDQVLVLVNGKRRHQQALVNVQQSIGRGSAGTDINTIPISAIERIEILRDGASAQYGSDAIAGVINIILKSQSEGGSVMAEYGKTYEGDGRTYRVAGNGGFKLGGGFLNITGEYVERGETNRAGLDSLRVSPPRVTQRIGDAETKSGLLWVNGAIPFGRTELYFFGGASSREGNSSGFFRPSSDGRTIPALYPAGFLPTLLTTTDDYSFAVGLRGDINRKWTYDLSINRGHNQFEFASSNSANVSWYYEPRAGGGIFGETPTSANDGTLRFKQWTANFDVKGTADWGIGKQPLALAAGLEWRQDGYQIIAGDPVSYTYGRTNNPTIFIPNQGGTAAAAGIQGFPGFSPATEVDGKRSSFGIYGDAEAALTSQLLLGAALRFEDYSDAGTNTTGKASLRFQATPQFAVRGSERPAAILQPDLDDAGCPGRAHRHGHCAPGQRIDAAVRNPAAQGGDFAHGGGRLRLPGTQRVPPDGRRLSHRREGPHRLLERNRSGRARGMHESDDLPGTRDPGLVEPGRGDLLHQRRRYGDHRRRYRRAVHDADGRRREAAARRDL